MDIAHISQLHLFHIWALELRRIYLLLSLLM